MVLRILGSARSPKPEITEEAMRILEKCSWPGNVRELKNVLGRAMILSRGETLTPQHFSWLTTTDLNLTQNGKTLRKISDLHIRSALERYGGDDAGAAKSLGISRATFYRRLKESRSAE